MNRTRAVLTALVLSTGLVLAGCSSDDPAPQHDPSPTTSTSPVESTPTGPVEPTMPAEAMGTSKKAAEAFVEFYWEMVNYAQESGDVSGLEPLSRKCTGCDAGTQSIRRAYEDGGYIRGGSGHVADVDVAFFRVKDDWWATVDFEVESTKQEIFQSDDTRIEHHPGGRTKLSAYLQPADGSWILRTLDTT